MRNNEICTYCLQYRKKIKRCSDCGLKMCDRCFIEFKKKKFCYDCFTSAILRDDAFGDVISDIASEDAKSELYRP